MCYTTRGERPLTFAVRHRGAADDHAASAPEDTAKRCHFPTPLRVRRPRSSNWIPDPATRSLTVPETSISSGLASAATRAPIWTDPADLAVDELALAGVQAGSD